MKLELLDFLELQDYPDGTGIEFFDDKIYMISNSSPDLLIMSKKWNKPARLPVMEKPEKKGSKSPELEAVTLLTNDKKHQLLMIGSGDAAKKNQAVVMNLKTGTRTALDLSVFYNRIKEAMGSPSIRIDGIAEVYDYLVMVNRGSSEKPGNHLIITKPDFWKNQEKAPLQTILINFEKVAPDASLVVTALRYSDKHEDLFLTLSISDGPATDANHRPVKSYLAVIENLYRKIGREKGKITVNQLIDLQAGNPQFNGFEIESACIQSQKDHSIKLQLVARNAENKTCLFKVVLSWG